MAAGQWQRPGAPPRSGACLGRLICQMQFGTAGTVNRVPKLGEHSGACRQSSFGSMKIWEGESLESQTPATGVRADCKGATAGSGDEPLKSQGLSSRRPGGWAFCPGLQETRKEGRQEPVVGFQELERFGKWRVRSVGQGARTMLRGTRQRHEPRADLVGGAGKGGHLVLRGYGLDFPEKGRCRGLRRPGPAPRRRAGGGGRSPGPASLPLRSCFSGLGPQACARRGNKGSTRRPRH